MELFDGEEESRFEQYELPFSPEHVSLAIPPAAWIERFFGHNAAGVLRILEEDASRIRHPSLARFREIIFRHQPFAFVHDYRRWRLEMRRKQGHSTRSIYLELPQDPEALRTVLSSYQFGEHELIEEFYTHFYGLEGSPTDYFNFGFYRPEGWERFESYGWEEDIERFDPGRKWARSLVIFGDGSGFLILLDPTDGDTAWLSLLTRPATGPFVPFTSSFAALLDMFVELSKDGSIWPDYYDWIK